MIRTYQRTLPRDRRQLLESYRYVHAARKVVGVGSVGARTWILLFVGRDDSDPLFLQFKEAQPSVLEPFLGRSEFDQHGQRVVEGQRMMQAAADILLGWERIITIDGEQQGLLHPAALGREGVARGRADGSLGLEAYGRVCGWTLARAHARSGDRIAIAAYLGSGDAFDRAMASFAEAYASQNERDYAALAGRGGVRHASWPRSASDAESRTGQRVAPIRSVGRSSIAARRRRSLPSAAACAVPDSEPRRGAPRRHRGGFDSPPPSRPVKTS